MVIKKSGRPFGTTQHAEKKTKNVTIKVQPSTWKWLKNKPRGWLAEQVEAMAAEDMYNTDMNPEH